MNKYNNTEHKIAPPILRLLSFIIDFLIWYSLIAISLVFATQSKTIFGSFDILLNSILLFLYIGLLLPFINSFFISRFGATPGKLLVGLKIVDKNGKNLSFWTAFWRNHIGYIVSGSFLWLGFLWIMVDKKRRSWHDMIAGSWVVETKTKTRIAGVVSVMLLLSANILFAILLIRNINKNTGFYQSIYEDFKNEIDSALKQQDGDFNLEDLKNIPTPTSYPII